MRKKLQIFISSTFTDLQEERQAAVEAVLKAGHIPAGMELFRSGDQSQIDTITKWIEESDAYMLILGGRYGSIEEKTGKSYTHWEYDLAGELKKPRFAVVMKDNALRTKIQNHPLGPDLMETKNTQKYDEFKKEVLSKVSQFFEDEKDIKLTVMQTLSELQRDESLLGWVSGTSMQDSAELANSILELNNEIKQLRTENERLKKKIEEVSYVQHSEQGIAYNEEDAMVRTSNILRLLGAVEAGIRGFGWGIYDGDQEEKSYTLMPPPADYDSYFIITEHGEESYYQKCLIVREVEVEEFPSALAQVRVMIHNYKEAEGVPIHFVLVSPHAPSHLQDACDSLVQKAIKLENIDTESVTFKVELWNQVVLSALEDKLGIAVNLHTKNRQLNN